MKLRLKEPFVILLVGTPLAGKTTWVRNNYPDVTVISRDEIVIEVHGSRNYTEAFKSVNQKEVDRLLNDRLIEASDSSENVIIDMTHMTPKRRRYNLSYFDDNFYKVAVIFPFLSDDEYERRNIKRKEEENKDLPLHVIKRMISQYQPVNSFNEGFDKIITI